MPLVSALELLQDAQRGGYAVGAFSINNLESMEGILAAAERLQAPVIFLAGQGCFQHSEVEYFAAIAKTMGGRTPIPFSIQLDHGADFGQVMRCIRCGFPSVMIDASSLPFEENVQVTREVVRASHAVGVSVEGEIGNVPRPDAQGRLPVDPRAYFTVPEEAARFVEATGVDVLAIAYGSVHGVYKGPKTPLDFERLAAIREHVPVPLALHGGTGVSDGDIRRSIQLGITKINVGTELRRQALDRLHEMFTAAGEPPTDIYRATNLLRDTFAAVTEEKIRLFGSAGRA